MTRITVRLRSAAIATARRVHDEANMRAMYTYIEGRKKKRAREMVTFSVDSATQAQTTASGTLSLRLRIDVYVTV